MGAIAGIAISALISGISGAMGAAAQQEAYEALARASEKERQEFQRAYDQAFGPDSYNAQMQQLGAKAGRQFYDMVNDSAAWDRYINGDRAYVAPQGFSYTASDFTDDPSYKVRLKEGLDALDQSNVTNGLNLSGAAIKATNDYAQDQASKEFASAYNREFQRYTDDRNFDFNAWKAQADQYYENLQKRLAGLDNVSSQGVNAQNAQAQALDALANRNAAATQQQATAQGAAGMAGTQQATSILDSIGKGINMGLGYYASQAGATPTSTTAASSSPTNAYTLQGGLDKGGQDFASLFLNGWNPATNTSVPTTQNLVGA